MNETDIYREIAPPAALRSAIACVWFRRGDGRPARILPDACTDIVWRPGAGAVIAGPDTGPRLSTNEPGEIIVGVRFLPGAGGPALGIPLAELRDQRVEFSALNLAPGPELSGDLDPARVAGVLARIALRQATEGPPDRAVQAAAIRLLDPRQRVERLARELGFSERQLRRRFLASVGYGPKTAQRVLRLRRLIARSPRDLARAAYEAGYADQAHLTRECARLTGLTPAVLLSRQTL